MEARGCERVNMRCMLCGAEMQLTEVVPDRELQTPGYEHHSFECAACGERETRLIFSREPRKPQPISAAMPTNPEPVVTREPKQPEPPAAPKPPPAPSPPKAQESTVGVTATARGAWEHALARLRTRQSAMSQQAESAKKSEQA